MRRCTDTERGAHTYCHTYLLWRCSRHYLPGTKAVVELAVVRASIWAYSVLLSTALLKSFRRTAYDYECYNGLKLLNM
jgi:hypothetical protein